MKSLLVLVLGLQFILPSAAQSNAAIASQPGVGLATSSALPLLFFPANTYYSSVGGVTALTVADVNKDGKPDVLVANCGTGSDCSGGSGSVAVLLGNGDGTFQTAVNYDSGGFGAEAIAVADVNKDGKPDVLVANCGSEYFCSGAGSVAVLLGNGDGTFQPAVTYDSGGSRSWSIAVADVNKDGKLDVVVANQNCYECNDSGSVGVLLGNGDGTFKTAVPYSSGGPGLSTVVIADVNGDKKPDLVVSNQCGSVYPLCKGDGSIGVLLGLGDGTFEPVVIYDSGGINTLSVAVADLNRDGKLDLVASNVGDPVNKVPGTVGVLRGNGDGTFQQVQTYNAMSPYSLYGPFSVTVADINKDGKLDLVVGADGVGVLLGNGDGTFGSMVLSDFGQGGETITVADLNGDGRPDVVVNSPFNGLGVLLNNKGAQPTSTTLTPSVDPVTINQSTTYTATVTPPSGGTAQGSVEFFETSSAGTYVIGAVPLGNNQASLTFSYSHVGVHQITAAYSGALNLASASVSSTITEYVRGISRTVVVSSGSPSMYGQPVTFTATVTSNYGKVPDGEMVTFALGSTVLGSVPLTGGQAKFTTSTLPGGTQYVKGTYVGDNGFAPSTGSAKQVVQKYATTATLTSSLNPSSHGQPVTFTAKVASAGPFTPTGKVFFYNGSAVLASVNLSSGAATLTRSNLTVGTHAITARYFGDAGNNTSVSNVVSQVVK